jgi:hypothetical protein
MKKDMHAFKKFQAEWMTSDIKPKGRILKKIKSSARQNARKEIQKEVTKNGRTK